MINNPYIEIVTNDPHIISNPIDAYSKKGKWNLNFSNNFENYLEIGTGLGNFFSIESSNNLDKNFIGMEIRYKRLFKTAEKSRIAGTKNFVVIKDFGQNIDKIFENNEISRTYIFFPDPWENKVRQMKHKLLSQDFVDNLYNITKKGGEVFFKTDHLKYFEDSILFFSSDKWKINLISRDYENETKVFDKAKLTEFESMFREDKLKINYVEFVKF